MFRIMLCHSFFFIFMQCNETTSSNAMELEGFKRGIRVLEDNGIAISHIVTDRHPSIRKYIRTDKPAMKHYFDYWHVAKGTDTFSLQQFKYWLRWMYGAAVFSVEWYNALKIAGIRKKLVAWAGRKDNDKIKKWIPSIVNHLYWAASTFLREPAHSCLFRKQLYCIRI